MALTAIPLMKITMDATPIQNLVQKIRLLFKTFSFCHLSRGPQIHTRNSVTPRAITTGRYPSVTIVLHA